MSSDTSSPASGGPPDRPPESSVPLPPNARWMLTVAVGLTVLYVILDIVAQLLPPHYSAVTQAESDLAVGPFGYVMTINFVVRGLLTFALLGGVLSATTIGRRSPVGVALLAVWGAGAFVLAAFPTDIGAETTTHGMIHLATAALAFLAAAVGVLLLSVRFSGDPRLAPFRGPALLVSVGTVLALLALFYVQVRPRLFAEAFGLVERLFIGGVLLWMLVVALYLLRSSGVRPDPTAAR
jgi:hypothetical protein